jgi:PIN domain nuclease of toxin-antitoxin system
VNVVLDTHALVWWRTGSRRLSAAAAAAIDQASVLLVPDITLWELCELVQHQRIALATTPGAWIRAALAEPRTEIQSITPEIAIAAASLKQHYGLDPVDALVTATAVRLDLPLVTRDERLSEIPSVTTVW